MQVVTMSTPARKRLMRDFKRLQQDPPAGISGAPQDNNIMLWNAVIFGWVVVWKCIKNVSSAAFFWLFVWYGVRWIVLSFLFCLDCSPDDTPWDGGELFLLLKTLINWWNYTMSFLLRHILHIYGFSVILLFNVPMGPWGLVELVRTIC